MQILLKNKNFFLNFGIFTIFLCTFQTCLSKDLSDCDKSFKLCIEKKLCECNSTQQSVNKNNNIDKNKDLRTKTTGKDSNKIGDTFDSNTVSSDLNQLKCRPSKNCFKCMGDLYAKCCNRVEGLCPKTLLKEDLSRMSHIGDFKGERNLFNALTKTPSAHDEWTVLTFSNDLSPFTANLDSKDVNELTESEKNICTTLFMDQCLSANQCEKTCESLGANSYRWFHNGCCECIGEHCLNYGINRSQCKFCGNEDEEGAGDSDYSDDKDEL